MCYLNTELSEIGPHTETCSPHTRTTAYSANKSICTYISSNGYPIGWAGGIRNCTAAVQEQKEHCLQTSMHLHVHAAACTFMCMLQLRTVQPVRTTLPAQSVNSGLCTRVSKRTAFLVYFVALIQQEMRHFFSTLSYTPQQQQ